MSEVMSKTWNLISHNITSLVSTGPRWTAPRADSSPQSHLPTGLANFLDTLMSCDTKEEEGNLVKHEMASVQAKMLETNLKTSSMADAIVRAMACHILGYDVAFAHVYALQLAQKGSILEKKMGYLACTLFLTDSDELILLLINTLVKDLNSTNIIELNMALNVATSLIPADMAQLVLPSLYEKLTHSKEFIRKKALICMEQLFLKDHDLIGPFETTIYQTLNDPDPGVVATAVQVLKNVINVQSNATFSFLSSLLAILGQVQNNKLPSEYLRRGIPAPFVQVDVLRLISTLIEKSPWDSGSYELVTTYVLNTMEGVNSKDVAGQAIISECIYLISVLNKCESDIARTSKALFFINKFLQSKQNNIKYVGLTGLADLCRYNPPKLSESQEENVLNCLSHQDESIKRKTLSLMVILGNSENVKKVCEKILEFIRNSNDEYHRMDLINKTMELIEKFSSSLQWKVNFMLKLLQVSSGQQREEILTKLKSSVTFDSEVQCSKDEISNVGWKMTTILRKIVSNPNPPTIAVRLYVWCLSKGFLEDPVQSVIFEILTLGNLKNSDSWDEVVVACLESMFVLITEPELEQTTEINEFVEKCLSNTTCTHVNNLALELNMFLPNLKEIRCLQQEENVDTSDATASFLDSVVVEALKNESYMNLYVPVNKVIRESTGSGNADDFSGLRFTPYQVLEESQKWKEFPSEEQEASDPMSEKGMKWSLQGHEDSEALKDQNSTALTASPSQEKDDRNVLDLELDEWRE